MNKIDELYNQIKDYEDVLAEYNTSKSKIKLIENDIESCEAIFKSKDKEKISLKINELEGELSKVENEIKKIDLCSKECNSLSDIKMMFKFVPEENVLSLKALSYLESLVYPIYVDFKQVEDIFKPAAYREDFISKRGVFKVLKISLEVDEFFNLLKARDEIYNAGQDLFKKLLKNELNGQIPSRICCYVDPKYFYLLFLTPGDYQADEHFLKNLTYVGIDSLNNLENVAETFYEIFKRNLCKLLLKCAVSLEDVELTNQFFSQTEFFITNVEEWKLDCAMKEIITLSKKEKSWSTTDWLSDESFISTGGFYKQNEDLNNLAFCLSPDVFKHKEMLPLEISEDFFRILLCIKILISCKSKRIEKAEKIVERALLKMLNLKIQKNLLHHFIAFSELTVFVRLFPGSAIASTISTMREETFFTISKISTELTKSLNDSLLLLKVYFKEKHYDFMLFVDKFVPPKSKMAFEINFFNLLYANICDYILCIKYIDNEKAGDISRLIRYVLDLSAQVPSGCIEQYKRMDTYGFIFRSSLEEIIDNSSTLTISPKELETLLGLLFKSSREIRLFLKSFDCTN